MTEINTTDWNPSNTRLAELTGLPNLDNIIDTDRLHSLSDIAYRKSAGMLRQGGNPLRYLAAADRYAERAAEKAEQVG